MNEIWAIVLAAGESKRMGFPKMLLKFHGSTMVENVIMNIKNSDIENILVVLGAESDLIKPLISGPGVKYCINADYKEGMLSSVKCGLRNLPSDPEAVLVFQGDQPLISSETINAILKSFKSGSGDIIIPIYNGKRGHPLLIGKRYLYEIEKLENSEGLRSLAHRFSENVKELSTNDPGILRDFDTFEEYMKEINQTN